MQSLEVASPDAPGEVQDPADDPMGKIPPSGAVWVSQSCTTSAFHGYIFKRGVSNNTVQSAASINTKNSVPAAVNPGRQQV
jgi:hypothetical protein